MLISSTDFTRLYPFSRRTFWYWIKNKRLKGIKEGSRTYVDKNETDKMMYGEKLGPEAALLYVMEDR